MLIPGLRQQGLILPCESGAAGTLLGGWIAAKAFHVHGLQGFLSLSAWLTLRPAAGGRAW